MIFDSFLHANKLKNKIRDYIRNLCEKAHWTILNLTWVSEKITPHIWLKYSPTARKTELLIISKSRIARYYTMHLQSDNWNRLFSTDWNIWVVKITDWTLHPLLVSLISHEPLHGSWIWQQLHTSHPQLKHVNSSDHRLNTETVIGFINNLWTDLIIYLYLKRKIRASSYFCHRYDTRIIWLAKKSTDYSKIQVWSLLWLSDPFYLIMRIK
jgi:hypothetical protein